MTALLDTNVLIRHLTGDPPDMAAKASAYLVASAEKAGITEIASFDRAIDRVPTITRIEP